MSGKQDNEDVLKELARAHQIIIDLKQERQQTRLKVEKMEKESKKKDREILKLKKKKDECYETIWTLQRALEHQENDVARYKQECKDIKQKCDENIVQMNRKLVDLKTNAMFKSVYNAAMDDSKERQQVRDSHQMDILSGTTYNEWNEYVTTNDDKINRYQMCFMVDKRLKNILVKFIQLDGECMLENDPIAFIIDRAQQKGLIGADAHKCFKDLNIMRNELIHLKPHNYVAQDVRKKVNKTNQFLNRLEICGNC